MAPGLTYPDADMISNGLSKSDTPSDPASASPSSSSGDEDSGSDSVTPIAVVGLSLKFPQEATSPESFWKMLMDKRCAMTEVPSDRFNINAFHGVDNGRIDTVRLAFPFSLSATIS
jgi:hypothetical protein